MDCGVSGEGTPGLGFGLFTIHARGTSPELACTEAGLLRRLASDSVGRQGDSVFFCVPDPVRALPPESPAGRAGCVRGRTPPPWPNPVLSNHLPKTTWKGDVYFRICIFEGFISKYEEDEYFLF